MSAYSARNARVTVTSAGAVTTNLMATKWTVNMKVDELDVSNFEGFGYVDYIPGLWEADISFDAIWGSGAAAVVPTASLGGTTALSAAAEQPLVPPIFYPGTYTGIRLFMDSGRATDPAGAAMASNDATAWSFPKCLICSASHDAEVRGFIKYSITAKNKGIFSLPF